MTILINCFRSDGTCAVGDLGLAVGQEALLAAQEQAAQEAEHARVGVQDEGGDVCIMESAAFSRKILPNHVALWCSDNNMTLDG